MSYPIKTLNQLPLILKGFRKERRLTQAAMGEKLGITQQSYAAFEANPAAATLDRLFMVLRLLDVEISLEKVIRTSGTEIAPSVDHAKTPPPKTADRERLNPTGSVAGPAKEPATAKASHFVAPARKKESW